MPLHPEWAALDERMRTPHLAATFPLHRCAWFVGERRLFSCDQSARSGGRNHLAAAWQRQDRRSQGHAPGSRLPSRDAPHQHNIATLHLGRQAAAQDAIAIVGVDQVVHEPIQQKLRALPPRAVREGTQILGSSRLIEFEVRDQGLPRGSQRMYPAGSGRRLKRYVCVLWTCPDGNGAGSGELFTTFGPIDPSKIADGECQSPPDDQSSKWRNHPRRAEWLSIACGTSDSLTSHRIRTRCWRRN